MLRTRQLALAMKVVRGLLYLTLALVAVAGLAVAAVETSWGKDRLRGLIVAQANQLLTATLEIDRLEGSLFGGVRLSGVRLLSEGGEPLVQIDDVTVDYSLRELVQGGVTIRSIRLVRPRISAARGADGRWNLASLVRRDAREEDRSGPGRAIRLGGVEMIDGAVSLGNPVSFGGIQIPTRYEQLNLSFGFEYIPVSWSLAFTEASWVGTRPDLTMTRLSGTIASGREGLRFSGLEVRTPDSAVLVNGRLDRQSRPSVLELDVNAERFSFQEWSGMVSVLRNMAVSAGFTARLQGPLAALTTEIDLQSNAGGVVGSVTLDTQQRPWRGKGGVEVSRLDLSRWLNRTDRPSDITGRVDFDLQFGPRFPRGTYAFDGAHAAFMTYAGDDVRASGRITEHEALIATGVATAYGANVTLKDSSIALARPYAFRFQGTADGVDLRLVPPNVPVPHVESTLVFTYDVAGQFASPFIRGTATFGPSLFLGAAIADGTTGGIDTSLAPFRYTGDGEVTALSLARVAQEIDIEWLRDPRYDGTIAGRFQVQGTGGTPDIVALEASGRLQRADLFGGTLSNAGVSVSIAQGSLRASYDGELTTINPARALDDPRFEASLTGRGTGAIAVRELLLRPPTLGDYDIRADLTLGRSELRGIPISAASGTARLSAGTLSIDTLRLAGPSLDASGEGTVELDGSRSGSFVYRITRADLARVSDWLRRPVQGELSTVGRLTGPTTALRVAGEATVTRFEVADLRALATTGRYDVTIPPSDPGAARGSATATSSFLEVFGQELVESDADVSYDNGRIELDVALTASREALRGRFAGAAQLHPDRDGLDLFAVDLRVRESAWRLAAGTTPSIEWDEAELRVNGPLILVDQVRGDERITISGNWRNDGSGALGVAASRVTLDPLLGTRDGPVRYGGRLDLDATIRGTRASPIASARVAVTQGRIRRVAYERLDGRLDYANGLFELSLQLTQAPGTWLTASGTLPLALFSRGARDLPIHLAVSSSAISLGLVEGVTDRVRDVGGTVRLAITAVGTARDPHFAGTVDLADAAFTVTSSGARYRNGRAFIRLTPDRVLVESFQLEDSGGRPLEVRGSLGTHELKVGDVAIDLEANGFEVLRNDYGNAAVNAGLTIRGHAESPRVAGIVTLAGGTIEVNAILDRTLLQAYPTENKAAAPDGAPPGLDPWERLGIDVELRVPNSLRLVGDNVQVTAGTPLGIGDFNIRVLGDLFLYKDPGGPLYVTGSLDSVTGSYAFQGRRFEIDPSSSINFRGDLNPELYVTVQRQISGVEVRVVIAGPLREPELRLTSVPPLDQSDILSMIVFNTTTNELSAAQQQELAVRAGTLAAGFVAAPLLSALQRSIGLETLAIEPGSMNNTTRVTIGSEIAPGLIARFSRQFGSDQYDEATVEYALSRIFRLRASFSDAGTLSARSPFRRVERAGIDLLLFFSF
jgi:autotransporter translocation and assembly factor TamB